MNARAPGPHGWLTGMAYPPESHQQHAFPPGPPASAPIGYPAPGAAPSWPTSGWQDGQPAAGPSDDRWSPAIATGPSTATGRRLSSARLGAGVISAIVAVVYLVSIWVPLYRVRLGTTETSLTYSYHLTGRSVSGGRSSGQAFVMVVFVLALAAALFAAVLLLLARRIGSAATALALLAASTTALLHWSLSQFQSTGQRTVITDTAMSWTGLIAALAGVAGCVLLIVDITRAARLQR